MVVGIVSPGAMGSGVARSLAEGGHRVVATLAGRGPRTHRLATGIGSLDLLPTLGDVVAEAAVVLSIVPPAAAQAVARDLAAAAGRTGSTPLVADLNAIAPGSARSLAETLARHGLDLVDGSISGPPPGRGRETRVYVSGPRAAEVAALGGTGIRWTEVEGGIGTASAVKMSTAAVYKGTVAVVTQALAAARRNGVLEHVLDDLERASPDVVDGVAQRVESAASKARRYVGEMDEIAATQAAAGLTPALFEGMAEVYRRLAETPLAAREPEDVGGRPLADVLDELEPR